MFIQLAPFRLGEGVDEAALLTASDRFQGEFVAHQRGVQRRVVMRGVDGGYADLVFFEDRDAADRVLAAEATSPEFASFLSVMEPPAEDLPDLGVLSFEHVRTYDSSAQPVVECVVFGPAEGVDRAEFVVAAGTISEWARAQPGFVSRELFEAGEGRWIDIVRWATMDDAHAAAQAAMESSTCAGFFGLIDVDSLQMLHGSPMLRVVRP